MTNIADLSEIETERARLVAEFEELGNKHGDDIDTWPTGVRVRAENLSRAIDRTDDQILAIQATRAERAEKIESIRAAAESSSNREAGFGAPNVITRTGGGETDRAARIIDTYHRDGELPDAAAEKMERLLKADESSGAAADYVKVVGAPAYRSAFDKLVRDPLKGHLLWTGEELAAYQAAEAWSSRAMSTTVGNGGYLIPLTLDPTVILTSAGSINPLRRIARTVETMTGQWKGISSSGSSMEWKTEGAQAADGSFTVDDEPIPVHFGSVFVPYSFEVEQDGANFTREVQRVMVDAVEQGQATAYTTGDGSGEPTGIITALVGGSSLVTPTTAETFTAPDVYKVQNALPARFQARAQWCAALATINSIAQFETTNGALKFPEVGNDRLLRKPLNELSNMDGTYDAAATANNYILLYGDFSNFVIVDQVGGSRLELLPNLTGADGRPTGQRGLYLWARTGSDSVNDAAFRCLNVATTA
jgi:HK97 family phage major capsid protein